MIEQAKSAPSAAALLALAQENGITLTAEEATLYFAQLHPKAGALFDDELDNVSGGIQAVALNREKCFPLPKAPTPKFDPLGGSTLR